MWGGGHENVTWHKVLAGVGDWMSGYVLNTGVLSTIHILETRSRITLSFDAIESV